MAQMYEVSAERARVTSMIIVIGIIVFLTGITAFIAGRLQSKGAALKQDISAASRTAVAVDGGDPAQKLIVNTEERERLRVMKQMNDQLLLGVITGGIVTISILIVSMLIVNMGELQRRSALEQFDRVLPLPSVIPYGPPQAPMAASPRRVGRSPRRSDASPRRRIKKNAGTSPMQQLAADTLPPARASDFDDFADAKAMSDRLMGGADGDVSKSLGQLNNREGGERNQLVNSEALKLRATFYSKDADKQAEREALRAAIGTQDLDDETAKKYVRDQLGIVTNDELVAQQEKVMGDGAFGKVGKRRWW